jgi:hypothetical protein
MRSSVGRVQVVPGTELSHEAVCAPACGSMPRLSLTACAILCREPCYPKEEREPVSAAKAVRPNAAVRIPGGLHSNDRRDHVLSGSAGRLQRNDVGWLRADDRLLLHY